jgi:hypothetical protein
MQTIPDEELAQTMAAMVSSPLEESDIAAVVASLTAKQNSGAVDTTSATKKLQSAPGCYNYFDEADWAVLKGQAACGDKMFIICKRMLQLGLRNPTEKAFATMLSVISHNVSPSVALEMLRELKKSFRSMKSNYAPPTVWIEELPLRPAAYKQAHPDIYRACYGDKDPVQQDDEQWQWHLSNIPLRSTRACCSGSGHGLASMISGRSTQSQKAALASLVAAVGRNHSPDIVDPTINLQVFGRPQPSQVSSSQASGMQQQLQASGMQQQLLALPAPPQQLRAPSSSVPLLQLQDGTPPANSESGSQPQDVQDPRLVEQQPEQAVATMVEAFQKKMTKTSSGTKNMCPVLKRPASEKSSEALFSLGCSKCRYSSGGCKQCRRPEYSGKRGKHA